MRIFGAGMAGLVAANMLRRYQPVVFEAQEKLPDNHGALLRFRSERVARAVNQEFKKVLVKKGIVIRNQVHTDCDPQMANLYSYKVTGKVHDRSIWDLTPVERWIAPPDFIERMAEIVNVNFGFGVCEGDIISKGETLLGKGPCVSTIPMPTMMHLSGWKEIPDFPYRKISTMTAILPEWVDVYQTLYYPDPSVDWYRASVTGRTLTVERIGEWIAVNYHVLRTVLHDFGIPDTVEGGWHPVVSSQRYGKLSPIPEEVRRAFILWLTNEFEIYSVGRFATWRQILLDDVVQDIEVAEQLIRRDAYARALRSVP